MPTLAAILQRSAPTTGALHELLAPCGFAGTAVLTKRGDVFRVLRLHPPDAECLDESAVEGICRQFDSAMRTLGTEYRVYQYLFRESSPELAFPAGAAGRLSRARAKWLESHRSEMYGIEVYLVILRQRPPLQTTRAALSKLSIRKALDISSRELAREEELLGLATSGVAVQLRENLAPVVCDRRQTMRFLKRVVNVGSNNDPVRPSVQEFHVDQQIAAKTLEVWPSYLKQAENYIRLYSLVEAPAQTLPHLLRSLLQIPCNMTVCSEWKREPNAISRREIDKRRRHYHFAKTSIVFSGWMENSNRPTPAHEVLVDDSKTALVAQLNDALKEMEVKENFYGRYALCISLWHPDLPTLDRATPRVFEAFATHDAKLLAETQNMINAWAAMVPGNYAEFSLRQMWMLNTCWAEMSFLFAPGEGQRNNTHLNKPCLAVVETREQTPWYLNLHVQDVAHTCILGSTGSGKTFLLNFLIAAYQQYAPYTVIFDLLGNYRRLTKEYNGGYLQASRTTEFTINPLCGPHTPENSEFVFSFVRVLAEQQGTTPLNHAQRKDLYRAIEDVYALAPEVRTLSSLARMLSPSYSHRLDEWVGEGRLAQHFDHVDDTITFNRFQTFDFGGMDKAEVLEPLLFYILHRVNATVHDPTQQAVPKLVVYDEAWRFFKHSATRSYIHEALKTWRNLNGAILLATQSANDMLKSELLSTVAESCMTRIFHANPGMDPEEYREAFGLNATVADLISRLVPKREFLLSQPGVSKVLQLDTDAESYKVFSGKEPS